MIEMQEPQAAHPKHRSRESAVVLLKDVEALATILWAYLDIQADNDSEIDETWTMIVSQLNLAREFVQAYREVRACAGQG